MRAIEFFSGIGAFAEAARKFHINVVAAYDQSVSANAVYQLNFGLRPCSKNLDSIKAAELPQADLWWLSPPCTPYSVRGKQHDLQDPRAASLINLLAHAAVYKPSLLLIENVMGFKTSAAKEHVKAILGPEGYQFHEYDLCPTMFGVPMKRTRHFVAACRVPVPPRLDPNGFAAAVARHTGAHDQMTETRSKVSDFLFESEQDLWIDEVTMQRYGQGFDIVDPADPTAQLICFTKNYARCMRASGSMIKTERGLRRVSPNEILRLLGFSSTHTFPSDMDQNTRWRLVGNSVDVRAIEYLLGRFIEI